MKTKSKLSAYVLRSSTTVLLFSCVIVGLCSAIHLPEQPRKARPLQDNAFFGANGHASVASMPASASDNARKSVRFEFLPRSANALEDVKSPDSVRARVGTAREENLIPPAGLKPVEQEAWLAMARRQGASGGNELASFYPERHGEAFVVEGEGVRVAVRPVSGTDVMAQIDDNGQVIYRQAYPETDSVHVVSAGRTGVRSFCFCKMSVRRASSRTS